MGFENLLDLAVIVGAAIILAAGWLTWRFRRRKWIAGVGLLLILIALSITGYSFWYTHRPLPTDEQRTLFTGVEYIRDVRPNMIIHVVRIDLDTPNLRFLVTPSTPTDGRDQAARTTSQFLTEFNLQLAINGDFFDPWRDYGIFDYYPHVGDPVNLRGKTASNGELYTGGYTENVETLYLSSDNRVTWNQPPFPPYNAISGNVFVVREGAAVDWTGMDSYLYTRHPRTAVGLDRNERTLIMLLVDGRQPNYSDGATLPELAESALEYGASDMINLDGGGSTALVIKSANGEPMVLNSPIHNRIPGRERPIANHLGIYFEQDT